MTRSRLIPVLLSAGLLIGAANLGAYAASGKPFLLGKSNTATKTTTLKTSGSGAALALKTKPTAPPLKVKSRVKVANFNADMLDGKDSVDLATTSYRYTLAGSQPSAYIKFFFPGLPAGIYDVSFNLTAAVGGSAAFTACYFVRDSGQSDDRLHVPGLGVEDISYWYLTAAGQLDARSRTYSMTCQASGATSIAIPASTTFDAEVVFTKTDTTVNADATSGPISRPQLGLGR